MTAAEAVAPWGLMVVLMKLELEVLYIVRVVVLVLEFFLLPDGCKTSPIIALIDPFKGTLLDPF